MSIETETQLEAFIAANFSGGNLKKIELSELTFSEFENYLSVYGDKLKARTAFIDNVFLTFNNTTMKVFSRYNDEYDRIEIEYSSMGRGTIDNLIYVLAYGDGIGFSYAAAYTNDAFLDSESLALLKVGSKISCDIYTIE